MKTIELKFKHKKEEKSCTVAIPSSLQEAVKILGMAVVYEDFCQGLILRSKKEFLGQGKRKKKYLKIPLETLTPEQREALLSAGIAL